MMLFQPLKGSAASRKELKTDYKTAKVIGVVRLGQDYFFFRRGLKIYYITYEVIVKCFRRVLVIPAGNSGSSMKLETLVIADESGELAQIQVPGTEAAKSLMDAMKEKLPHADFTGPDKV